MDRLLVHLAPLKISADFEVWTDEKIAQSRLT